MNLSNCYFASLLVELGLEFFLSSWDWIAVFPGDVIFRGEAPDSCFVIWIRVSALVVGFVRISILGFESRFDGVWTVSVPCLARMS